MSRDCDARTFENRNIGREARRGASAGDAQGSSYTCEPHVTKGKVGKGRESERDRERERERERERDKEGWRERMHLPLARAHHIDLRHSIMFPLHR